QKTLRGPRAPVPEKLDRMMPHMKGRDVYRHGRLERVLSERLAALYDVKVPLDAWRMDAVPDHLRMNVQVRANKGALVDQDRDVGALTQRLGARVANRIAGERVREKLEAHGLAQFPSLDVPAQRVLDDGGGGLIVCSGLAGFCGFVCV